MNKYTTLSAAALAILLANPSSAAWKRLSDQDFRVHPKNLARHHIGAQLQAENQGDVVLGLNNTDRNLSAEALLTEDPTLGTPIAQGTSSFLVSLDQIEILNTLNFVNEGGVGKVTISTALTESAASSGQWHDTGFVVFDADRRVVSLQAGGIDAKFVKVTFEMAEPGRIYSFGIFGESSIDEYALESVDPQALQTVTAPTPARGQALVDLNLLGAYTGARVAYVSSGSGDPTALIDADSSTTYRFDSTDLYPTVIVDLGGSGPISRVSALYSKSNTRMAIFAMNELPESVDWVGRTSFEPSALDAYKPHNMGSDIEKTGRLALDVPTDSSRFLIFQFARGEADTNFEVNELAAFSDFLSTNHVVLRSEWNAKSYAYGKNGAKNPGSDYDDETSHRMLAYSGPLAGYSGASFMRRGSGGIGSGGGFGNRGNDNEIVQIVEREVIREVTTIHSLVDEEGAARLTAAQQEIARLQGLLNGEINRGINLQEQLSAAESTRVQVVSRIAVSETTVEGIGHLYLSVGEGALPPGFTFEVPNSEGTHAGGLILADTIEDRTIVPGEVIRFNSPGDSQAARDAAAAEAAAAPQVTE